jgi:hypothetical protein
MDKFAAILVCVGGIILATPGGPPYKSWAAFALFLIALLSVVIGWPR